MFATCFKEKVKGKIAARGEFIFRENLKHHYDFGMFGWVIKTAKC